MARFLIGDTLGSIKALSFAPSSSGAEPTCEIKTLLDGSTLGSGSSRAIQALVADGPNLITALRADGTGAIYAPEDPEQAEDDAEAAENDIKPSGRFGVVHEWKEPRFRKDSVFVGLECHDGKVYTCTSNGALRMTVPPTEEGGPPSSMLATLPMRLKDWKLGPGARMFAYAGDEVELSVWDVGRAFSSSASNLVSMLGKDANSGQDGAQKKRKRRAGDDLLPGEVWRAKNVANDELSLRVPVHHTSLVFLSGSTSSQNNTSEKTAGSGADVHILTGTHGGAVRRYDTRAARKPVADWKEIVKKGPVRSVQSGCREHEAFVSDQNSNLSAIDLRNGRVLYSYKGLAATVTAHTAPLPYDPYVMASTGNDRYVRLHSTLPPPREAGRAQGKAERGDVLTKVYVGVVPTCVVWDGSEVVWDSTLAQVKGGGSGGDRAGDEEGDEGSEDEEGEQDVWDEMEDVQDEESDDDDEDEKGSRRKAGRKRRK